MSFKKLIKLNAYENTFVKVEISRFARGRSEQKIALGPFFLPVCQRI